MIENLFLSAGAMKAGTTWVYDKLKHNPNIHFSREKEIYYFSHIDGVANSLTTDKRLRRAKQALRSSSKKLKQGELKFPEYMDEVNWYLDYASQEVDDDWYFNLYDKEVIHNPDFYCADFSNLTCFLSDTGWGHVKKIAKNIKVIYILRNPIERFWSHYKFHLQFVKHAEMNTPEQNIKLFDRITSKPWFIRNSMYSENIKNMQRNLEQGEFKVYYLDDISADPEAYLKDIESFIGVAQYDYSKFNLQKRNNTSIQKSIPLEWEDKIKGILHEEIFNLKQLGYFHSNWEE